MRQDYGGGLSVPPGLTDLKDQHRVRRFDFEGSCEDLEVPGLLNPRHVKDVDAIDSVGKNHSITVAVEPAVVSP